MEAAWAEGRTMTSEQAIEYALEQLGSPRDRPPQRPTPPDSAPGRPKCCAWSPVG